jgi:predicted AAA+ superfamily ATPase
MLALFVDALRERVGGMITLKNIAEDLQISPTTAKLWLSVIEKMYMAFTVFPLTQKVPRAILKPPKIYFYDNADVIENTGGRLENLVATTLLKRLHFIEDYYGYRATLHYIRDKEGREVDFVTVINGTITDLIEVKTSDSNISSHLKYYTKKLNPQRAIQLVAGLKRSFTQDGITVTTPVEFFNNPPWTEESTEKKD